MDTDVVGLAAEVEVVEDAGEVVFVAPVFVGDIVSFYARLIGIGRTSITVKVVVEADRVNDPGRRVRVTEAEVVYVAVDDDRRPVPIQSASLP